jgi:hypothetical protein
MAREHMNAARTLLGRVLLIGLGDFTAMPSRIDAPAGMLWYEM